MNNTDSLFTQALNAGWTQVEDVQLDADSFREVYAHPTYPERVTIVSDSRGRYIEAGVLVDGKWDFRLAPADVEAAALVWLHLMPAN